MPHADTEKRREYHRAYREKNREALAVKHHARYEANKEDVKSQAKAWAEANPDRKRETRKAHYSANKDEYRERRLRAIYGIGIKEYDERLAAQDGHCAICPAREPGGGRKNFHVDHNHDTGEFRGLLCSNCNTGLGQFRDNSDLLIKAAIYLRQLEKV